MKRLGIYEHWPSRQDLVSSYLKLKADMSPSWSTDLSTLRVYSEGGNSFKSLDADMRTVVVAEPPLARHVMTSLSRFSGQALTNAVIEYLTDDNSANWLDPYTSATSYRYHSLLIQLQVHIGVPSLNQLMVTVSQCVLLGWLEEAKLLTSHTIVLYRQKQFFDVAGPFSQPLLHWFTRICFAYHGLEFNEWGNGRVRSADDPYKPGECLGEPVLNKLLENWKVRDLTQLQDELVWVCDYYTYRASEEGMEFHNEPFNSYFPLLIFAWFRLRASLGLENPKIDHPLMQTQPALPAPKSLVKDDLLEAVLHRLQKEEIQEIYKYPPTPLTTVKKKRWF